MRYEADCEGFAQAMRKGNDAFVQGGESCSEAKGEAGRTKSDDERECHSGRDLIEALEKQGISNGRIWVGV